MSFADREPQSANEALLRTIAVGADNPFDRDPQSANEYLLKKIAGEDVPEDSPFDREPQSAIEYWLKQIAENGGGGGVEMESGELVVEASTLQLHLAFKNTHNRPPDFATVQLDVDYADFTPTTSTMMNMTIICIDNVVGKVRELNGVGWHGIAAHNYYGTSGDGYTQLTSTMKYSITDEAQKTSKNCPLYFISATEFSPIYVSGTTAKYFYSGAKYKWYAFWL